MSHSVRTSNFVPTIDRLMDSILIYTCDYFQNLFYVLYLAHVSMEL